MPRLAPELHERKYIIVPIAAHHLPSASLQPTLSTTTPISISVSVGILVALWFAYCSGGYSASLLFGQTPPVFSSPPPNLENWPDREETV